MPSDELHDAQDHYGAISDELEKYRPRRGRRYVSVAALILSWKDKDLKIDDELDAMEDLFRNTFHYEVQRYQIPSQRPQNRLAHFLSGFLLLYGNSDSLVIVYYGGHGGPTKDGSTCEWAASIHEAESPSLDWSAIQPQLYVADCDVVILLDCCYAGLAVRGHSWHNVEALVATDKDQLTPIGTGRWPSFTKVLIQKMKEIMDRDQEISIPNLHNHMVQSKSGLRRQPFYVSSAEGSAGKILLKKWTNALGTADLEFSQIAKPSRSGVQPLFLEVYTYRPLESTVQQAIIRWLTKDSPSSIADIALARQTVSNATSFQSIGDYLLKQHNPDDRGHALLPHQSQHEINRLLKDLEEISTAPSPQDLTDEEAMRLVKMLKQKSVNLTMTVEDLLATLERPQLEDLRTHQVFDNTPMKSRIDMRLTLLDNETTPQPSQVNFIDQAQKDQRFRIGKQDDCEVLIEYWYYEERNENSQSIISKQVARISALLMEPKTSAFRSLHGTGYVHERLFGPRFGYIYHRPQKQPIGRYAVLSDVIEQGKHVPLEVRIRVAEVLCEAMLQLHSVGWYHKAIKSSNVLLFCKSDSLQNEASASHAYDFEEPYLIGFDCSRPADAETRSTIDFTFKDNLYRHPERWGKSLRFKSYHDLYAFGILLLEIGCWRLLPQMDSKKRSFEYMKDPEQLRQFLLSKAFEKVAHYAGTRYASSVRMCFEERNWTDTEEWQLQRVIRNEVLAPLKACGRS